MRKTLPALLACILIVAACDDPDTIPTMPPPVASRVGQLTVYPSGLLRTGGSVAISVRVTDPSGTNIVGGPVRWATSAGTLSAGTTTTDNAGFASVTLNGREPATVTAEVTGVAPMTVTVPAVDPFTVSLQLLSTTPTTGQPVGVLVNAATTREVPNAPAPTAVLVDCGNGETLTPALGALAQCRYGTAGPYVITGTASANGFATNATAALTVTPAPNLTPPTPVGPLGPAVTLTATELHKTPTTATWRFRATASGGDHSGDWQFFVDYVQSPASGATPQTRTSSSDTVDVTYQANGTKQIRVAGNVGGSTVTGETTIIVTFGP